MCENTSSPLWDLKIPTLMPRGGVLGACLNIHNHNKLVHVFAIGRGSDQLWQIHLPFPYESMFGIACLNDQIDTVLLSAIRRDSGQPVQINIKKTHYKLRPVRLRLGGFRICLFQYPTPFFYIMTAPRGIHKVLNFVHTSVMIALSVFYQLALKH